MEAMRSLKQSRIFRRTHFSKLPRITPSQWGVLMLIEQCGKSSVKDVAHALHISSSAATQLVDGLVESGYVEREKYAKDRRAVVLTLSKKTEKQVGKMKKQMSQKFLEIFEVLSDKEFTQYCALNKKIVQRFLNKN